MTHCMDFVFKALSQAQQCWEIRTCTKKHVDRYLMDVEIQVKSPKSLCCSLRSCRQITSFPPLPRSFQVQLRAALSSTTAAKGLLCDGLRRIRRRCPRRRRSVAGALQILEQRPQESVSCFHRIHKVIKAV